MAKDFWFKFYPKDWRNDTILLSTEEKGLLLEIILYMRENDGECPIDFRLISRLTEITTENFEVGCRSLLEKKIFDVENRKGKEYFISRKIKRDIHRAVVNKENGGKGGNPYLKNRLTNRLTKSVNRKSTDPVNPVGSNSVNIYSSNSSSNVNVLEKEKEKGVQGEKEKKKLFKTKIPTIEEFLLYCQSIKEIKPIYFDLEFSLKAKYDSWVQQGWKDGNGRKIANWKTKIKNTIPFLKKMNHNNLNNNNLNKYDRAKQNADDLDKLQQIAQAVINHQADNQE